MPKYVTHNADGSGDGSSLSSPWAIAQAAASAVAGDEVRICATGTYELSSTLTITAAGSVSGKIKYWGASAAGAVDGTRTLIRPTSGLTGNLLASVQPYLWLRNLELDARDSGGVARADRLWDTTANNTGSPGVIEGCDIHHAKIDGLKLRTVAYALINCRVHHCTQVGVNVNSTSDSIRLYGTVCDHNGSHGFSTGNGHTHAIRSMFYRNGGNGVYSASGEGSGFRLIDSLFYANASAGIYIATLNKALPSNTIYGCTAAANGTYGYRIASVDDDAELATYVELFCGNHSHGNSSGHANWASSDAAWQATGNGANSIVAPAFASTTDGAEDFSSSALEAIGWPSSFLAGGSPRWGIGPMGQAAGGSGPIIIIEGDD